MSRCEAELRHWCLMQPPCHMTSSGLAVSAVFSKRARSRSRSQARQGGEHTTMDLN